MRHTIGANVGFTTNETKFEMNNELSKNEKLNEKAKKCCKDAWTKFRVLKNYQGNDFGFVYNKKEEIVGFVFGIEPSYQYDELQIIKFDFADKNKCCLLEGKAWGVWGSNVVKKSKLYGQYKRNCTFKNFIDKWFDEFIEVLEEKDE